MVPLSIKEMRESSCSDVNKFVENCWDDGFSVYFKVKASLLGESEELLQHKSGGLLKDWIYAGMDESSMTLSILLGDQNLVLYVEVRDVVFKVDIFGDYESSYDIISNLGYKTIVGGSWVYGAIIESIVHFLLVI